MSENGRASTVVAAERLGVPRSTLQRLVASGEVPSVPGGSRGRRLLDVDEARAALDRRQAAQQRADVLRTATTLDAERVAAVLVGAVTELAADLTAQADRRFAEATALALQAERRMSDAVDRLASVEAERSRLEAETAHAVAARTAWEAKRPELSAALGRMAQQRAGAHPS